MLKQPPLHREHPLLVLLLTALLPSALLALAGLSGPALAAENQPAQLPLAPGHYAIKRTGCDAADTVFFELQGKSLRFKDFSCQIQQIRHYGGIRYLLDMACKGPTMAFEDSIALDIDRDKRLFLHYPNIGSNSDEFILCKGIKLKQTPPAQTQQASAGQAAPKVVASKEFKPQAPLQFSSAYQGQVGKSKVEANLDFYQDGRVIGQYVTQLLGNVYQLEGENPKDGLLRLREYTNGRHTADVELRKGVEDGKMAWVGQMHNRDGRVVKVVFIKKP
jgi:hypothetical protein